MQEVEALLLVDIGISDQRDVPLATAPIRPAMRPSFAVDDELTGQRRSPRSAVLFFSTDHLPQLGRFSAFSVEVCDIIDTSASDLAGLGRLLELPACDLSESAPATAVPRRCPVAPVSSGEDVARRGLSASRFARTPDLQQPVHCSRKIERHSQHATAALASKRTQGTGAPVEQTNSAILSAFCIYITADVAAVPISQAMMRFSGRRRDSPASWRIG